MYFIAKKNLAYEELIVPFGLVGIKQVKLTLQHLTVTHWIILKSEKFCGKG